MVLKYRCLLAFLLYWMVCLTLQMCEKYLIFVLGGVKIC